MPVLRRDLKMERVSVMDFWSDASPEARNRANEASRPHGNQIGEKGDEMERRRKSGIVDECVDVQKFRGILQSDVL